MKPLECPCPPLSPQVDPRTHPPALTAAPKPPTTAKPAKSVTPRHATSFCACSARILRVQDSRDPAHGRQAGAGAGPGWEGGARGRARDGARAGPRRDPGRATGLLAGKGIPTIGAGATAGASFQHQQCIGNVEEPSIGYSSHRLRKYIIGGLKFWGHTQRL